MRKKIKKTLYWLLGGLLCFGLYIGSLQLTGNFHSVIDGEFYRSAQPSGADLRHYIEKYQIKTIINLRGANPDTKWYQEEEAVAKEMGVQLINFRMSARRELPKERAIELIEVMRNAPKPILMHCQAGADRSGLAAALYIAAIKKGDEEEAEWQLSPVYGHLPFGFADAYPMTETFEKLEEMLGYHGS